MPRAAGISYAESGAGAPPILCLHGIGGDETSFAPQLAALSDRHRIIALNLPGYGGSDPLTPLTFAALAGAVTGLMDALDLPRAHLLGQSIGGMIALETAVRAPERVASLALIATTAAFGGRDPSFREAFLAARLAPLDAGETMPSLAARFVPEIVGPTAQDAAKAAAIAAMARVPVATYRATIACLTTFNRRDALATLRQPTCLIAGEADTNAPAKTMARMAESLPNATFHALPGVGHLTNLEAPEATNRLLRAFYGSLPCDMRPSPATATPPSSTPPVGA